MSNSPSVREHIGSGATVEVDVLVVGAGVAGLVAALDVLRIAPQLRVAVLDKGRDPTPTAPSADGAADEPGGGGSTPLAQGGMAAAMGVDDSPELHAADTIRAGDGLCDPRAVAVVTTEGPARVADLIDRGAVFDREQADGPLALAREGGQSTARSVRAADATGAEIARALRSAATGRVLRLQGIAVALRRGGTEQRVVGTTALLDRIPASPLSGGQGGGPVTIDAHATVLATGGCGGLYAATTNPDGATADGVALAHRVGVELVDLEFVQFHPTGLAPREGEGFQRFLLTEALRGAGAVLLDDRGQRFMPDRHPDAELAPRYVVTKAILEQPHGVWLDATHLPRAQLEEEFPTVLAGAARAGYDLGRDPVPVEPCEHYMIGGVATDLHGRTSAPGLWAAGEVACTGVHGANRMAGNSLLQSSVFGHRVACDVVSHLDEGRVSTVPEPVTLRPDPDIDVRALRTELREAMTTGAGAIRTREGLAAALKHVRRMRELLGEGPFGRRDLIELDAALTVARLIARSALLRTESRGVHWRTDHPQREAVWAGVRMRVGGAGAPDPA